MESGLYVRCMGKVPRVPFLLAHSLEFTAKGNQDMQDDRQPSLSNGKWVAFWKNSDVVPGKRCMLMADESCTLQKVAL